MINIIGILSSVTCFSILFKLDIQLAELVREKGCPVCGGPLHYARFERNPLGCFVRLPDSYRIRQGLCCGHCRKRVLPTSSLFMGRKGAFRCAILVFLTLRQQSEKSAFELSEMLGIDVRTLWRWVAYFRDIYPSSSHWQRLRGFVSSQVKDNLLPGSLVVHFIQHARNKLEGIVKCIQFMVSGETVGAK